MKPQNASLPLAGNRQQDEKAGKKKDQPTKETFESARPRATLGKLCCRFGSDRRRLFGLRLLIKSVLCRYRGIFPSQAAFYGQTVIPHTVFLHTYPLLQRSSLPVGKGDFSFT